MKPLSIRSLTAALARLSLSLVISSVTVPEAAGEATTKSGPQIAIVSPELGNICSGPINLDVRFESIGVPVDLSTLRVKILKFVHFDITDKVRPYVSETGIQIKELSVPKGTHTVEISLADVNKTKSSRTFTVKVN